MAPGSTAGTLVPWTIRVTTTNSTYTLTGANDSLWPDTSSSGYFNRYDRELVVERHAPVLTRALRLRLWTSAALERATVDGRQQPARAPLLAPRRLAVRQRCAAAHCRWRAAYAGG